jgi:TPR repeat protein
MVLEHAPRRMMMTLAAMLLLVPAMVGGDGAQTGAKTGAETGVKTGTGAEKGALFQSVPTHVFRQSLPAALAGNAAAQYELGRAFADGAATRQDLAEAARWYQQAADQGNARAQNDLAMLYTKGLGVPQDYVQAYVWFDLAAVRFGAGLRHDQAAEMRDMMGAFLTPEQFAEAQRLSEEKQAQGE